MPRLQKPFQEKIKQKTKSKKIKMKLINIMVKKNIFSLVKVVPFSS